MISKIVKFILIAGLSISFSSCSEFLKGKKDKKETLEVNSQSLSCLKDVASQIKSFMKPGTTTEQIDSGFACIDQTLNEFQARVEGRAEADSFTADELFEIFERFLKDAEISKEAANDLLLLKSALLGGTIQKITKKEISDLRNFLNALKPEIKILSPYVEIFAFKKGQTQFSKEDIQKAFSQLNQSIKKLLKITTVVRSEYQFEDFKRLITHLHLLEGEQSEFVDLATKVKNLLVGNYNLQTEVDYLLFIDNLTEVLRLYAVQVQGLVRFEISTSASMKEAIDYVQSWLGLLERSVQYKNKQMISVESLNPLVEVLANKNILPIKVKGSTLVDFYKILVVRVFEAGREGDVNKFLGLGPIHLTSLKREIAIYKIYMQFIEQAVPNENRRSIKDIQIQLQKYDPSKQDYILQAFDKPEQEKIVRAVNELKSEFLSARPVVYRYKKMVIAANQSAWDQNWEDLARGFYSKMLARELLIGWGLTPVTKQNPTGPLSKSIAQSYVLEEGLIQWYAEFKFFGIESKTFDKRSENTGSESFKQADLLTYSADGDGKLSYFETVQFVNMLISGGGQTLSEIREGLQKAQCNLQGGLDAFDFPWNDEACTVRELKKNFKYYFSNLSWLNAFVEKQSDEQFADFYSNLMQITRYDKSNKGIRAETADFRAMSVILYYIESLYAVYDVNGNSTFSTAEIRSAYARFKSFAKDYAYKNSKEEIDKFNGWLARTKPVYGCYSEEDLIRESFIYLVYNGKTPTSDDLKTCTFGDALIDFSQNSEVDRKTIINTFKILKAVLGSNK